MIILSFITIQCNGFGFYSTSRKAGAASVTTSWNAAGHSANIHIAVNIRQDNTVLPLTLLSFTGAAQHNHAVLNWVTADEVNVSHTEVQRSTNGTDFSFVSKLQTSVKGYVDINALNLSHDKLFYRLKLADLDGNFTYSPVLSIQAGSKTSFITAIQPQFASGRIAVSFNVPQEKNARLLLTDVSGKTIRSMALTVNKGASTSYMESLQSLPAGIYVLQVICGEEKITKQLLK
ncbi:MAG: T9SS type A sorting domain-containing protein [Chitinophagaceae bacterium]|nr:MAG: T9SS type A sorting domain-containing protein [Chitinophagaceae bacterium]